MGMLWLVMAILGHTTGADSHNKVLRCYGSCCWWFWTVKSSMSCCCWTAIHFSNVSILMVWESGRSTICDLLLPLPCSNPLVAGARITKIAYIFHQSVTSWSLGNNHPGHLHWPGNLCSLGLRGHLTRSQTVSAQSVPSPPMSLIPLLYTCPAGLALAANIHPATLFKPFLTGGASQSPESFFWSGIGSTSSKSFAQLCSPSATWNNLFFSQKHAFWLYVSFWALGSQHWANQTYHLVEHRLLGPWSWAFISIL